MTDPNPIRQPEPTNSPWTGDPEVPEADADEQRRDLLDDPGDTDPETLVGRDRTEHLAEPPLEVNEADLADQLVDVPFDDDLDRW